MPDALIRLFDALGNPRLRSIAQWFDEQEPRRTTERERILDRYERYYWGLQYEERNISWDGRAYTPPGQRHIVSHPGNVLTSPPPWYYRRPFVHRGLCRAIVDRFTDLLYGEDRLPQIVLASAGAGPTTGQDWLVAALQVSRWWERWSLARTLGGATGSVVVSVKLREGRPVVEVHNAKWCRPMWVNDDPDTHDLAALEVRYERPVETYEDVRTSMGVRRRWVERREMYRRIITDEVDVVMTARLDRGAGPLHWQILDNIEHGLGFVPAVWVTNTEVVAGIDGSPDCEGLWDNFDALDAMYSDAFAATHYNADPTLVLRSRRDASQVQLGSQTALLLWPEESAELLEMRGTGSATALEMARILERAILEDAACVLTPDRDTGPTATHVLRRESQMLARADQLRRQYGAAMENLCERMLRMCRAVGRERLAGRLATLEMPDTDDVLVRWPRYLMPSAQDEEMHVRKIGQALAAGMISKETAVRIAAPYLGVQDPETELQMLRTQEDARMAALVPELGYVEDGLQGSD